MALVSPAHASQDDASAINASASTTCVCSPLHCAQKKLASRQATHKNMVKAMKIWFCCAAALMRCTTKKNERVAAA